MTSTSPHQWTMTSTKLLAILAIQFYNYCHALSMEGKRPFLRRIRSAIAPFTLPWYENGLNFECTGCGKCCMVDGDVWLAPEEVCSIMAHLGNSNDDTSNNDNDDHDHDERNESSITDFRKNYIRAEVSPTNGDESQSWMCLKRKEGACVFLDQRGQCGIYAARPVQCRTYPFWPSLLTDSQAWEEESVLPDNTEIREGTSDRHWSPEFGGCEGIMKNSEDESGDDVVGIVVERKEIQSKMKAAAQHWKRFPVREIKESTWYL